MVAGGLDVALEAVGSSDGVSGVLEEEDSVGGREVGLVGPPGPGAQEYRHQQMLLEPSLTTQSLLPGRKSAPFWGAWTPTEFGRCTWQVLTGSALLLMWQMLQQKQLTLVEDWFLDVARVRGRVSERERSHMQSQYPSLCQGLQPRGT